MQMGLKAFSSSCPHPPLLREPLDVAPTDPPPHQRVQPPLVVTVITSPLGMELLSHHLCTAQGQGSLCWHGLGVQCPQPFVPSQHETPTPLPSSLPPQTHFPITPSCTHTSQPTMWQGIKMLVLGPHHRKPHRAGARFQAQAVPLHSGLSSQKGQDLLPSSSFYNVHKKIKITGLQMYKPASKPQSMYCDPTRGSKST